MLIGKNFILFILAMIYFSQLCAQDNITKVIINDVSFNLPGKWKQLIYREESGQYGFLEEKTKVNIAISARKPEKMEFYNANFKKFELVAAYYEWDSKYWATDSKIIVEKLTEDTTNTFIVWRIKTNETENDILFGLKANKLIGLFLNNSNKENKMQNEQIIHFLKDILLN